MSQSQDPTLAIIAIIISSSSLLFTIITYIRGEINKNKQSESQAKLNERLSKYQDGTFDLKIAERIANARANQNIAQIEISKIAYSEKNPELGKSGLEVVNLAIEEDYLNAYDEGCQMYLDEKIDKARFKKRYFNDIQIIKESKVHHNRLYPKEKSKYEAIHSIMKEWFTLEK